MRYPVLATVHKNGSSLAIVIPKDICRALDIERGDQLAVSLAKPGIIQLLPLNSDAYRKIIKA